jgi:hypothetical protein
MSNENREKIKREMDEFEVQAIEKFEHESSITLDEKGKLIFKVGYMYGIQFGIAHKKE